jgi:hypothetical protein
MRLALRAAAAFVLGLAACSDGTGPPDGPAVTAHGRVWTLDGGSTQGLTFAISSRAGRQAATVAADGSFQLRADVDGDTIDFIVEAASGTGRYHPAAVRSVNGTVPDLRIALVPVQWTIDRGAFAGTTVQLSPDAAFQPPCTNTSDTNCDGFYPRAWSTGMKLWAGNALPIRLAFDHARSHHTITPADSVTFWNIVERMNDDFGTALFRAARADDIVIAADGRPDRAVLVRVDTTLTGFGAWTNWWWDANGDMYAGVVRPSRRTNLGAASLMTHELPHTQGFKHSCSWQTVMGGYGCGSYSGLSAGDVAHAHAAIAMRDLQRESGAVHGLIAAMNGQRFALGLPFYSAPVAPRLLPLRGDEASELFGDHAH